MEKALGDITNTIGRDNSVGSLHDAKIQMPHKMQAAAVRPGEATEPDSQAPCTPRAFTETSSGAVGQSHSFLQSEMSTRADLARAEDVVDFVNELVQEYHSAALAKLASRIAVIRYGAASGENFLSLLRDMLGKIENEAKSETTEKVQTDMIAIKLIQTRITKQEHLAERDRYQKQQKQQAQERRDTQDIHRKRMADYNLRKSELVDSLGVNRPELSGEVAKGITMKAGIEAIVGSNERHRQQIAANKDALLAMGEKEQEKVQRNDAIGFANQDAEASLNDQKQIFVENVVRNRQMHNTYLSLKGNTRVFCRLRPQLNSELEGEPLKNCCTFDLDDDDDGFLCTPGSLREALHDVNRRLSQLEDDRSSFANEGVFEVANSFFGAPRGSADLA